MNYPLTFYVKTLPPNVGGCANGPVIRILEKYRNDRGIYEHEVEHVQQWAVVSLVGAALIALLWRRFFIFNPYQNKWVLARKGEIFKQR